MKVAIYCRLSEEDKDKKNPEDDSNSIQNQKKMLIDYAMQNDWEIYNIYSDDDYSGSDRNRPEFNRMIADAENRRFDIILCKAQSRFTRELELVEKYINYLLPLWGIRFVGLVDNADTANQGNKKARQITGLTNEWYIEDLSNDIRKVLHSKTKEGLHIGSTAAYGYIKDPDNKGHIMIDPEAAEVVRQIYTWSKEGYGIQKIARMLNERKIPNPSTYKEQKGIPYKRPSTQSGSYWKYYSVERILKNEVYIGNMVQGRQRNFSYKSNKKIYIPREEWVVVPGTHEPIISQELWDSVQHQLRNRTKGATKPGTIGPFSRKLYCKQCGHTLRSFKSHDNRYFRCPTRLEFLGECDGCYISLKALENTVLQELNRMIDLYLDKDELEKNLSLQQDYKVKLSRLEAEIRQLEQGLKQKRLQLEQVYDDKLNGIITSEEFASFAEKKRQELITLERDLDKNKDFQRNLSVEAESVDTSKKEALLKKYVNIKQLDRTIVEAIIDHIVVARRDPVTKKQEIEIFWNF